MVKATRVHQPVWILKIDGLGFCFFFFLLSFFVSLSFFFFFFAITFSVSYLEEFLLSLEMSIALFRTSFSRLFSNIPKSTAHGFGPFGTSLVIPIFYPQIIPSTLNISF